MSNVVSISRTCPFCRQIPEDGGRIEEPVTRRGARLHLHRASCPGGHRYRWWTRPLRYERWSRLRAASALWGVLLHLARGTTERRIVETALRRLPHLASGVDRP